MNLDKYINQIRGLKPMAQEFNYNAKKWQQLSSEHKILVSDFEDIYISRDDVVKVFNNYYFGNSDYMRAFLLTMIWGFGDTGYGTFRTNNFISTPANTELIKQSIDSARVNDLERAYNLLKKIKGLGVSYISKVLYFATRGAGIQDYALIFDNRVAQSLVRLFAGNDIYRLVNISPSSKFEDYQTYNKIIHQFAKQYEVEADVIELFLFNRSFDKTELS